MSDCVKIRPYRIEKELIVVVFMLIIGGILLAGGVLYFYDGINERKSNCGFTTGRIVNYRQNYERSSRGFIRRRDSIAIVEYTFDGKTYRNEYPVRSVDCKKGTVDLRVVKSKPDKALIDSSVHTFRSLACGAALTAVGIAVILVSVFN